MDKVDSGYAEKFKDFLKIGLPNARLDLVEVRPGENFAGEPSLFVKLVFARKPSEQDYRELHTALRAFRIWLSDEKSDFRFPHVEVSTRAEERLMATQS